MLGAGLVPELGCRVVVHVEGVPGRAELGRQQHERVAVLRRPSNSLDTDRRWDPDLGVRLLVRPHPGVHVAIVVVLALPSERSGIGPSLDDEVVRLLEALAVEHRRGVVGDALASAASDETGDQPAVADHVDHRQLFGQPKRVVPDRQYVAENYDLRLRCLPSEDRCADVRHTLHTERRAVMLVQHQPVEAHLLSVELLVKVPVVEVGTDLGII